MTTQKLIALLAAPILAGSLAACGGGDNAGSGTVGFTSDSADRYIGTWSTSCKESDVTLQSKPEVPLVEKIRVSLAKVGPNQLSYVLVTDIYATGSGCTGTVLASHTNKSASNAWVIDGTKVVSGVTVDKITDTHGNIGGSSSATVVPVGGLLYPGDYFVETGTEKFIARVVGSGILTGDPDSAPDAQGYPTVLLPTPVLVKL